MIPVIGFALLSAATALAQDTGINALLVSELKAAATEVDRFALLTDEQLVFDFLNPGSVGITTGASGHLVQAYSANFPAVIGNSVAMSNTVSPPLDV
jgi:hypothetical protein